MFQTKL